jgi:hypothetical protein
MCVLVQNNGGNTCGNGFWGVIGMKSEERTFVIPVSNGVGQINSVRAFCCYQRERFAKALFDFVWDSKSFQTK